jgi:hypothetical protein
VSQGFRGCAPAGGRAVHYQFVARDRQEREGAGEAAFRGAGWPGTLVLRQSSAGHGGGRHVSVWRAIMKRSSYSLSLAEAKSGTPS